MGGRGNPTAEARARMSVGARRSVANRQVAAAEGKAFVIAWRESRRCPNCGALGYTPCAHRPNGAHGASWAATATMPFPGHRDQRQVREDETCPAYLADALDRFADECRAEGGKLPVDREARGGGGGAIAADRLGTSLTHSGAGLTP